MINLDFRARTRDVAMTARSTEHFGRCRLVPLAPTIAEKVKPPSQVIRNHTSVDHFAQIATQERPAQERPAT